MQRGPEIHHSVDLRTQTYTEPVPLEYAELATKYPVDKRIFLQRTAENATTRYVVTLSVVCRVCVCVTRSPRCDGTRQNLYGKAQQPGRSLYVAVHHDTALRRLYTHAAGGRGTSQLRMHI